MWTAAGWSKPSTELWCWLKAKVAAHLSGGAGTGPGKCLGESADCFVKPLQAEARQKCEPQLQGTQVSVGVHFSPVCLLPIHGSSQLLKNTLLQKQKEQKCWGNLKGRSCAMYRNCDDSKSSLQASFPGKQNLMMFRLLPNFWHLRPCDCCGCSLTPTFFAASVVAVL